MQYSSQTEHIQVPDGYYCGCGFPARRQGILARNDGLHGLVDKVGKLPKTPQGYHAKAFYSKTASSVDANTAGVPTPQIEADMSRYVRIGDVRWDLCMDENPPVLALM